MASDLASIVQELLACGIHDPARKHPDDSPAKGRWSVITAPTELVERLRSALATPPGNATQAAGAREPLTNLQIADCATDLDPYPMDLVCVPAEQLVAFVRNIEAAHGIAKD